MVIVTALAAAVAAIPASEAFPVPKELQVREQCFHPGECGWWKSGQCEYHCDGYGGFMYVCLEAGYLDRCLTGTGICKDVDGSASDAAVPARVIS